MTIKGQDLIPFWEQIFEKRPADALPPDWNDLVYLFDHLMARTNKSPSFNVLEFGSGCSTAIIETALDFSILDRKSDFYALESSLYWFNRSMDSVVEDAPWHLRNCPVERIYKHNTWCFRYTNRPIIPVDFIYLDGPELITQIRVTYDPIDYEPLFRKGFTMIIDGRHETVEFLKTHLKRKYTITPIEGIDSTLFELEDDND